MGVNDGYHILLINRRSPEFMKFGTVLSLVAIVLMLACGILITDTLVRILTFSAAAISIAALLFSMKKKKKKD